MRTQVENFNKTISIKTRRNHKIIGFVGDSITNEILKKGEYDGNTLAFIDDVLGVIQPKVSLDIGANIGNHTLVIAEKSKKLLSFEPIPFLYDVLQQNIALNQLSHVQALNVGLSAESKSAEIFVDKTGNLGSSSITERHGEGELLPIVLRKGDDLLREAGVINDVDFIKIDVEGHEAEALIGLQDTITNQKPLILLEWRTDKTLKDFDNLDLFKNLFSGYQKYSITTTYSKKIYPKTLKGFLKRVLSKLFYKSWCLTKFYKDRHYANVCFVPPRHQEVFLKFRCINNDPV